MNDNSDTGEDGDIDDKIRSYSDSEVEDDAMDTVPSSADVSTCTTPSSSGLADSDCSPQKNEKKLKMTIHPYPITFHF